MGKISEGLKKWRNKQPSGAIMKPETFADIEKSAKADKLSTERAEKVAGAAYWRTAKAKYAKRKGKK